MRNCARSGLKWLPGDEFALRTHWTDRVAIAVQANYASTASLSSASSYLDVMPATTSDSAFADFDWTYALS